MRASSEARRVIVGAIVGLSYGAVLAFLSMLATGAGHGTYVPLYLSSAPLGAFGFVAGLLGAPLVWATFGALVAPSGRGTLRLAEVLALLHYASGLVLVVTARDELTHLERTLRISPELIAVWAMVYLAGQIALWRRMVRRNQIRQGNTESSS